MKIRTVAPTHIIVHHSLTKDGDTVSWGAIQDFHTKTEGWDDIGYHAGIERINGRVYAMIGRGEQYVAAAVKEANMNTLALHVCVVGNFDLEPPTQEVLDTLVSRVIKPWMQQYKIPTTRIKGHRDFASYKSCPGTKFDLDVVRKMAAA